MQILELTTPDGRHLTLYSSRPIAPGGSAPIPFRQAQRNRAQLLPSDRTRDRRGAASAGAGAGMFAMDVLPETTACQLQQVAVDLEDA